MLADDSLDERYRPCVGIVLLDGFGRIFVGRRIDMPSDYWQMPQGGIEEKESPGEAMLRELAEEAGIGNVEVLGEHEDWLYYDLPDDLKGRLWGGRYIGQKQKWFLCGFKGRDEEIDIGSSENAEFSSWKWAEVSSVVGEVVPFKREVYKRVLEGFSSCMESWISGCGDLSERVER